MGIMFEIVDGPEELTLLGMSLETDQPTQRKAREAKSKEVQEKGQIVSHVQTSQNGVGRSQSGEPIKS